MEGGILTRVAENRVPVPPEAEIGLDLLLGPLGGYTEDQYRAASNAYPRVHEEGVGKGWRSWAYWRFRLGEEPPDDRRRESIRLAELGELTPEEIAEIAVDAERCREFLAEGGPFYHGSEHGARERVELYEAVERALESSR